MKYFVITICLVTAVGRYGIAGETNSNGDKSSFLDAGPMEKLRDPLEQVFRFKIDSGRLSLDRAAWKPLADQIEKEQRDALEAQNKNLPKGVAPNSPEALRYQARQLERQADRLEREQRAGGSPPPLHALFRDVEARATNRGRRYDGPSYSRYSYGTEWQSGFDEDELVGDARTINDAIKLMIREKSSPGRLLEFSAEGDNAFRFRLTSLDGNMILLRQEEKGPFSVVVIIGGNVLASEVAPSFVDFFKRHWELMDRSVLPALAKVGVRPILSPRDDEVRKTSIALLARGSNEDGARLFLDLDNDKRAIREAARRLLAYSYDVNQAKIAEKLNDKTSSAEVRQQLGQIVERAAERCLVRDTIDGLDLLHDQSYVASLLDDVVPDEAGKITERMESLTGQKLGANPAAWKAWAISKINDSKSADVSLKEEPDRTLVSKSSLCSDGSFKKVERLLNSVLQFQLADGKLQIDRAAWRETAKGLSKNSSDSHGESDKIQPALGNDPQAAADAKFHAELSRLMLGRNGPDPPLLTIFTEMGREAGSMSSGYGSGGTGDRTVWHSSFGTDTVGAHMQASKEWEEVHIEESQAPQRSLEFLACKGLGFRLEVSNHHGDLISVGQDTDGKFTCLILSDAAVFADQRASFAEFCKMHHSWVESELLPAMSQFGFHPAISSPEMP
jgi:hypothetical protein